MNLKFEKWYIKGYNRDDAVRLVKSGYNPLVSVILASRDYSCAEEANELFKCGVKDLHNPFLLADMQKAVDRIQQAIETHEEIIVFGDYDVDGMTSACLMCEYLNDEGAAARVYIPGREDEGYGLSTGAIEGFAREGVSLIITVDCGITAVNEVEFAKRFDIDIVISDHHECKEVIPDAVAVINPKRSDCEYPNKSLAGVGVAFKIVTALAGKARLMEMVDTYSWLVALGTIADVVSVIGENRALIKLGLERLPKTKKPGINCLIHEAGLEGKRITSANIGYAIAPRLNAAGRMGCPALSVELLSTNNHINAAEIAGELMALNTQRRTLVNEICAEAEQMAKDIVKPNPIILAKRGWHQGVMGIVAARIAEINMLPSIMICIDNDGIGKGSCRSIGKFKLYEALLECSDLLINFGGHEMAAGITIEEKNIPAFIGKFSAIYHSMIETPEVPTLHIDAEVIKPRLLSMDNVENIVSLEPYGNGNPPPILCIKNAMLTALVPVGGGQHTKIRINKFGETFEGIFFSRPVSDFNIKVGDPVDVAFEPQINEFRGRRSVQMLLHDIKYRTLT